MGRQSKRKRKGTVTVVRRSASSDSDSDEHEESHAPAVRQTRANTGANSRASRSRPSPTRPAVAPTVSPVIVTDQPKSRGRGRPRKNPANEITVGILSFPVTERDEEVVQCAKCLEQMSSSAFRLHNLTSHYNFAKTTNDPTIEDHKFYEKRLRELTKLKNISTFVCPLCSIRYKSALGLSFHMEICGKSDEQIESIKIPCDICNEKFLTPNMAHHKKSQHGGPRHLRGHEVEQYVEGQRKSAAKARKVLREMETEGDNDSGIQVKAEEADGDWEDGEATAEDGYGRNRTHRSTPVRFPNLWKPGKSTHSTQKESIVYGQDGVITWDSIPFDTSSQSENEKRDVELPDAWNSRLRNCADPLELQLELFESGTEQENKLEKVKSRTDLLSYLPPMEKSIEFCTKTLMNEERLKFHSTDHKRLNRFESELIQSPDFNFIAFVGGSIKSLAWHPSGSILAISICRSEEDDPNVLQEETRKSSILIYCHRSEKKDESDDSDAPPPQISLELIVGLDYGYVNDLKWCNFWPPCVDGIANKCEEECDSTKKLGYLACAMEDSTVRIFSLNVDDLQLPCTYPPSRPKYRVYKKIPEVTLSIDENNLQTPGQCLCFDWHEDHKYLIAGYGSGDVAVYNLGTKSPILKNKAKFSHGQTVVTIRPVWVTKAHTLPVRSIVTDPANTRYFCSGSMDRNVKTWDLELREEIESKYIGSVIDMCWIRGWMHAAISCDLGLGYGNANVHGNFVRFYAIGNSKGVSDHMDVTNISSVDFREGLLAQGTELGKVTATYYDAYWREGDYDRNKKKKNYSMVCNLSPDEESIIPLTTLTRNETVETLANAAEAYQRDFEPKNPKFTLSITKDRPPEPMATPLAPEGEIFNATYDKPFSPLQCPQPGLSPGSVGGKEDCLILNVITPKLPSNGGTGYPVIVFVHGGAFLSGFASAYTASRFIDHPEDVLVVTINYRLGLLGFFCLENSDTPGNAALYDVLTALHWVKNYIRHFGGDPDNITLAGQSAGAVLVSYMMVSPLVVEAPEPLFHRAITMSGSALNTAWAINENPKSASLKAAKLAGCSDTDNEDEIDAADIAAIITCMREAPLANLTSALTAYQNAERFAGRLGTDVVTPAIQSWVVDDALIARHPLQIFKEGKQMNVPLIASSTQHDGSFPLGVLYNRHLNCEQCEDRVHDERFLRRELVPTLLRAMGVIDETNVIYDALAEKYLKEAKNSGNYSEMVYGLLDLHSVFFFKAGIYQTVELHSRLNPNTYFYSFEYGGEYTTFDGYWFGFDVPDVPGGVAHGDDLIYLLLNFELNEDDTAMSNKMVSHWINFAKTSNPNAAFGWDVVWPPINETYTRYLQLVFPNPLVQEEYPETFAIAADVLRPPVHETTTTTPSSITTPDPAEVTTPSDPIDATTEETTTTTPSSITTPDPAEVTTPSDPIDATTEESSSTPSSAISSLGFGCNGRIGVAGSICIFLFTLLRN